MLFLWWELVREVDGHWFWKQTPGEGVNSIPFQNCPAWEAPYWCGDVQNPHLSNAMLELSLWSKTFASLRRRLWLLSVLLVGDLNAYMGNNGKTWSRVIQRNNLPDLNWSAVSLLGFWTSHGLPIAKTMFDHRVFHKCTWYQNTLGKRSMINFVVLSWDLWLYGLDTHVKKAAELEAAGHTW